MEQTLTRILMKACSGLPLDKREKGLALESGLFYENTDFQVLMSNPSLSVQHLSYDLVYVLEFLQVVGSQLQL